MFSMLSCPFTPKYRCPLPPRPPPIPRCLFPCSFHRSSTWASSRSVPSVHAAASVGAPVLTRLPLELKTGRTVSGGGSPAHRAQVSIYSLLLADRRWHVSRHLDSTPTLTQYQPPGHPGPSKASQSAGMRVMVSFMCHRPVTSTLTTVSYDMRSEVAPCIFHKYCCMLCCP